VPEPWRAAYNLMLFAPQCISCLPGSEQKPSRLPLTLRKPPKDPRSHRLAASRSLPRALGDQVGGIISRDCSLPEAASGMSVALTNIHQMLRAGASVPSTRLICMASPFLCRSRRDTASNAFEMPLQRRYAGRLQGLDDWPEVGRVSARAVGSAVPAGGRGARADAAPGFCMRVRRVGQPRFSGPQWQERYKHRQKHHSYGLTLGHLCF